MVYNQWCCFQCNTWNSDDCTLPDVLFQEHPLKHAFQRVAHFLPVLFLPGFSYHLPFAAYFLPWIFWYAGSWRLLAGHFLLFRQPAYV